MNRPSIVDAAIQTARVWAKRSPDPKTQVGAVLMDDMDRVVGIGYNGRASGEPNVRESMEHSKSGFLHAEENCLLAANWNGRRHTLYCTHSPCAMCARRIINSKRIVKVIIDQPWHEERGDLPQGIDLLARAGIPVYYYQLKEH